jgi:hypothetical protein
MSRRASGSNLFVRGVVLLAVVLFGGSGCGKPKRVFMLPQGARSGPSPNAAKDLGVIKYRKTGGQAIAPVVVGDDPAPSAAAPTEAPTQARRATMNGHPNGITRETVNRSIQIAMGSLANCFTNVTQDPMVAVSFEAEPSGRPSLVRVNGAPPDAEKCIRSVMQGIRFPAFEGKAVQVDLPLSFHRVAQQTQPANPAEKQGEQSAPPLFLEP